MFGVVECDIAVNERPGKPERSRFVSVDSLTRKVANYSYFSSIFATVIVVLSLKVAPLQLHHLRLIAQE
jgi:hypothetical protein